MFLLLFMVTTTLAGSWQPVNENAPEPAREFRAAWVATAFNLDRLSKASLPAKRTEKLPPKHLQSRSQMGSLFTPLVNTAYFQHCYQMKVMHATSNKTCNTTICICRMSRMLSKAPGEDAADDTAESPENTIHVIDGASNNIFNHHRQNNIAAEV